MKIWLHINGRQFGPYSEAELSNMDINPRTPVWYEGLPNWVLATEAPLTAAIIAERERLRWQPREEEAAPEVSYRSDVSDQPEASDRSEVSEQSSFEPSEPSEQSEQSDDSQPLEADDDSAFGVYAAAPEPQAPAEPDPAFASAPWMQDQPYMQQPPMQPAQPREEKPSSLLWLSILLTVVCCNPFSIAAIVSSAVVIQRNNNDNIEGARRANETTQWLIAISIVLFIIFAPLLFIVQGM